MTSSAHFSPARTHNMGRAFAYFTITVLLAITAATAQIASAQIASGTTGIDATGNAQSERAACNSGKTQQSRDTCLTEVKNANAAKRAGKVDNNGGQFAANALKRCDVLEGENRIACQARIAGYGQIDGGVASGGVIREVETVVVPANAGGVVTVQPKTSGDLVVIPAQK
ncbi:MAG: hypothetical protein ACYCZ6_03355 [Polaromonas sp.]